MMKIELKDNSIGQSARSFKRDEIAALFPIADKSITELCKNSPKLLVFPHNVEYCYGKIGDMNIFTLSNTDNPDVVRIETGNIMGFIGVGGIQVKICSRFDDGRKDYFLHYMLQKVMSFNLFDMSHSSDMGDVFDLMMFMFPYYLKNAIRQGVYRDYKRNDYNDANVRGVVDFCRHIKSNIPFYGNVAYHTRGHEFDNDMTELIRHTIEFMKKKKYGDAVLNIDNDTTNNVNCIISHTPSYSKSERRTIISRNLRPKVHPYYSEYKMLQSLCLQILRMDEVKFGELSDDICGILFDGSWLWEEYLYKVLGDRFIHPLNREKKNGIYLFEDIDKNNVKHRSGVRYPDFYNNDCVIDAKYKCFSKLNKVSMSDRDDIHQIITYMNNLNVNHGAFAVPADVYDNKLMSSSLKDSNSKVSIIGLEISKCSSSYEEFCNHMRKNEEYFIKSIDVELS